MKIEYDYGPSGYCPVQAEGRVDGLPFYFRSRGGHWSLSIARSPEGDPIGSADVLRYEEEYNGDSKGDPVEVNGMMMQFGAGYAPAEECMEFIRRAADKLLSEVPLAKQRLLIALACGAKLLVCEDLAIVTFEPVIVCSATLPDTHCIDGRRITFAPNVPKYTESLDAMFLAEATLTQDSDPAKNTAWQYELRLKEILERDKAWGYAGYQLIHATPLQKAEAFLRALNLWNHQASYEIITPESATGAD